MSLYSLLQAPRLRRDLTLIVLVIAAQQILTFGLRDLWWADEVRHANVLQHLIHHGDWLVLRLNDKLYPDKPPVYFWFLSIIAFLAGSVTSSVIFAGLAISVLFYALSAYWLGRTLYREHRIPVCAIAVLVTGSYFMLLSHYARMDFLFGGFICLSWLFFYKGVRAEKDYPSLLLGFSFAAIATLTKGPIGILLPILSVISFLVWQRNLRRILAPDVAIGLVAGMLIVGTWCLGVVSVTGLHYLVHIIDSQVVKRGLGEEVELLEFARYCLTLPLVLLPWSLILLLADWRALSAGRLYQRISEARGSADDGPAFLWACSISSFLVLSLIAEKHEYYLVPLFIPVAILTAAKVSQMAKPKIGKFWAIVAGYLVLIGTAIIFSKPIVEELFDYELPMTAAGNGLVGGLLLVGALAIFLLRGFGLARPMIALVLTQVVWINAVAFLVLPHASTVMSPRALANELRVYAESGHSIGSYRVLSGVLAYHLGAPYFETKDSAKLAKWLAGQEKAAVAMRRSKWSQHQSEFPDMKVVFQTSLVFRDMVIVTKD